MMILFKIMIGLSLIILLIIGWVTIDEKISDKVECFKRTTLHTKLVSILDWFAFSIFIAMVLLISYWLGSAILRFMMV